MGCATSADIASEKDPRKAKKANSRKTASTHDAAYVDDLPARDTSSAGSIVDVEPGALTGPQARAARVLRASIIYGINGDPDQFPYTHEERINDMTVLWMQTKLGVDAPIVRIRAWVDDVIEHLAEARDVDEEAALNNSEDEWRRDSLSTSSGIRSCSSTPHGSIRRRVVSFVDLPGSVHVETDCAASSGPLTSSPGTAIEVPEICVPSTRISVDMLPIRGPLSPASDESPTLATQCVRPTGRTP